MQTKRLRCLACNLLFLAFLFVVPQGKIVEPASAQAPAQITARDREFAQLALSQVHQDLKKNYYDPTFHGVDIDDRYKKYLEQIGGANSIQSAYRLIEAYLVALNDSHTFFIPPPNSKRVAYGFQTEMIGDRCFITQVRPGSDAEQKLHPGDEVVSLNGYKLNRDDLWQLEYYLEYLPPRITTDFTLRDTSGQVRQETVKAEFQEGQALMPSSNAHFRMEFEKYQHANRSRSAEVGDVLLWKLASFNEGQGHLTHMLGEARKHRALILDLRQNSGGSVENLNFVLGSLFDHDVKIGTEVTRKAKKEMIAKSGGHYAFTGQLIVVIDSRSGSASEIVARVVQLEHRGIVVGDRSSGSVMTAQYIPEWTGAGLGIPYGVAVSVADLVMTDGTRLEHVGVTPDQVLLPAGQDLASGSDPVLAHAADLAGVKIDSTAAGKLFPFEWSSVEPIH
jgi:C-terminal processing protease CtpA/Prc